MEPVAFHSRSALRHAASACCPRNVLIRRWIPGAPYPTWMRGGWRVVGGKPRAVEPWISILLGWSSRVWSSFTFFVQGLVNVLSCGILNITLKYLLEISSIPSNYGWCSIQRFTWFTTPCCWNTWTTSSSSDSRFSNGESPGDLVRPRWPWWYEDHQPGWVPLHFASNRGAGLVFYLSSFTCC